MPRHVNHHHHQHDNDKDGEDEDNGAPIQDHTEILTIRNKRTERQKRKQATRQQKRSSIVSLAVLPTELLVATLVYLRPSDIFSFSSVNRRFHSLVQAQSRLLGHAVTRHRYPILAQCFPIPHLLCNLPPTIQALLADPVKQSRLGIHNRPYQHIPPPDRSQLCTCLTCLFTWNNLALVLDFAHWQRHLDTGIPLPVIPRGTMPAWNQDLLARNRTIARRAVDDSLWHARILQLHLDSTIHAIKRHAKNKGNQRHHVAMTDQDAARETDAFLAKPAPLSLEFPYQRDEYYMLEAYLPNRWWRKLEQKWVYTIAGQHERDLDFMQGQVNK